MPGVVEMDSLFGLVWHKFCCEVNSILKVKGEVLLKSERVSFDTLSPCFTLLSDLFGEFPERQVIVRQQLSTVHSTYKIIQS